MHRRLKTGGCLSIFLFLCFFLVCGRAEEAAGQAAEDYAAYLERYGGAAGPAGSVALFSSAGEQMEENAVFSLISRQWRQGHPDTKKEPGNRLLRGG